MSSNTLTSPEVQEARNSNQDEQLQNSDKNTVNESSSSNQDETSSSDQDEEGKPKTAKEMNSDSVDDSDDFWVEYETMQELNINVYLYQSLFFVNKIKTLVQ